MLTRCRVVAVLAVALAILSSAACEKVPLLAPTGSTITLTAPTNALAIKAARSLFDLAKPVVLQYPVIRKGKIVGTEEEQLVIPQL